MPRNPGLTITIPPAKLPDIDSQSLGKLSAGSAGFFKFSPLPTFSAFSPFPGLEVQGLSLKVIRLIEEQLCKIDCSVKHLEDKVGEGSEGDVFICQFEDWVFARKIVRPSSGELAIHQFLSSRRNFNPELIVPCLGIRENAIYMPYYLSGSLTGYMPFIKEALACGDEGEELLAFIYLITQLKNVAKALQILHGDLEKDGFMHGDLCPDNLLLDNEANWVVADFGCVQRASKAAASGQAIGRKAYLAPEVILQIKGYDYRFSDLWSLGVLLTFLLQDKPVTYRAVVDFEDEDDYQAIEELARSYISDEGCERATIICRQLEKELLICRRHLTTIPPRLVLEYLRWLLLLPDMAGRISVDSLIEILEAVPVPDYDERAYARFIQRLQTSKQDFAREETRTPREVLAIR
ncbi:MAG: hypothetical protein A3E87_01045 [Gammaproteobacteria bacterium RIFCSPHIGHO2_12_FULL_35_23]|nr:MAG: hypothetical protein A3E87_01045 [Gammaproteobacteria bacterium RIFCSPHIGHO2_12_FULL_35_23]